MIFVFLLQLVTAGGAGHLQAGEAEVLWGTESEVGRTSVPLSLHGGNGGPIL